jgi:hypothetical protein
MYTRACAMTSPIGQHFLSCVFGGENILRDAINEFLSAKQSTGQRHLNFTAGKKHVARK